MTATQIRWLSIGLGAILVALGVPYLVRGIPKEQSQAAAPALRHAGDEPHVVKLDRNANGELWKRGPWPGGANDPFHVVHFVPPAPASVSPQPIITAPEKPSPPQFPYRFFGRMVDIDGKTLTFLVRDGNLTAIQQGDVLDGTYRVDVVGDTQVQITYLPLGEQSTLTLPPPPQ